ncbi:hypothetical protein CRM90_22520 [Mycobacterium sp. ENV421]|uniref:hypothetical protein n=1 Tax=Mycobacterium sp. ENV421 TaxID=1213407 RepID=UPI000C99F45E|nr:hypothetical protein [Mycobacterium sp. ENV421]PND55528.1 hypothetical protein CRM90_22520 [Mycobacterium sp. ENV421]
MPTKTAAVQTAEEIDAEADAARAEHERLAARATSIRQAGSDARRAAEITLLRQRHATLPKAAREARRIAEVELARVAAAPELDLAALVAAFDAARTADTACHIGAAVTNQLNAVDPLPDNAIGVQQSRPPAAIPMNDGRKFSDYLDGVILRRASAALAARQKQLDTEKADVLDAADNAARQAAAQTADGRHDTPQPESIRDQYQRVIADITPDHIQRHVEENGDRTGHPEQILRKQALADLLTAETDDDHQDD